MLDIYTKTKEIWRIPYCMPPYTRTAPSKSPNTSTLNSNCQYTELNKQTSAVSD